MAEPNDRTRGNYQRTCLMEFCRSTIPEEREAKA